MHDNDDDARPIGTSNSAVQKQRRSIPWIWEGVLVEGAVTLLSAPEKVGKTTLLSLLLDRRRSGGQLLGRTVYPGKTVLCSEENQQLWTLRQPSLDFGSELIFHHPIVGCPTRKRWARFIGDVFELAEQDSTLDLLVVDTAVNFMPIAGRNARILRWAIAELSLVARIPAAVLILNQSRNVQRPLAAFADIVIEMAIPRHPTPLATSARAAGAEGTRRHTFTGVGRYPDTLQSAVAELNAEGTDYVLLDAGTAPQPPLLATLQTLLTQSPTPLTHGELLARWPGIAPRPDAVWRTLARGVQRGLFTFTGSGTKADARRFGVLTPPTSTEPAAAEQQALTSA
jgi:hypothetical protein